jgi:amidohydrolase
MNRMGFFKGRALKRIESAERRMREVSSMIHSYAEVGEQEFRSSELLCSELAEHGFRIEKGAAGIPTAFKAVLRGKSGPTVGLLAEYDALPEIGHGCGHNIIGTSATFAAIGLSDDMKQLPGSIVVLGTPDEEGKGGKIPMLERGVFRGIDAVIENHPFVRNAAWWPTVALGDLMVELEGRGAHYATPHKGANALDAALAILSTLNTMRHGFRPDVIFGYTLNADSTTPVIVAQKASLRIAFKATDIRYLREISGKIKKCVNGIAKAVGVRVTITDAFDRNLCFEESIPNLTLIEAVNRNFTELGINAENPANMSRYRSFYSSDYGNVSRRIPGVNFAIAIANGDISLHTREFAKAAVSREGHEALMNATKVMAMASLEIFCNTYIIGRAKQEFQRYRSTAFKELPLQPLF